jgi:hypothetical protein
VKKSAPSRSRHLQYETLESREVMAAGFTASLNAAGTLNVIGTSNADQINFVQKSGSISIVGRSGSWAAASVKLIVVDLKGGNDNVSFASVTNGGNQAIAEEIIVVAGAGTETVRAPSGGTATITGSGKQLSISSAGVTKLDGKVVTLNGQTPTPTPPPAPPTPPPPASNWFATNVVDTALRSLGSTLYVDGRIDRNDMINLLRSAKDNATIDNTELNDLRNIVANTTLFGTLDHVRVLSSYIVNGTVANARYTGQALGNLAAGASDVQMEKLIGKWFLGLDRPTTSGIYRQVAGTLFVNGAQHTDVRQGALGDCYLLATLAEVALRSPATLTNMFVVNGDGTYTVKFFNNASVTHYVTVDSQLPTDSAGRLIYASRGVMNWNSTNELWVALAEKAYVQLNEFGFVRPGLPGNGLNAYSAIEGGYIYAAMNQVTGRAVAAFAATSSTANFTTFVNAFNQGKLIGFASKPTPAAGSGVVGNHAYAVVGYNANNQTITLYNPWGPEYGLVVMSWSQIQANFNYFDRTV